MPFRGTQELRTNFTPADIVEAYPKVGVIVDMQSDLEAYDVKDVRNGEGMPLVKVRFSCRSKQVPSKTEVDAFLRVVDEWQAKGMHVAIHCHNGFNRTGYFCCAYLVLRVGMTPNEAISQFALARPPGIVHEHFKADLRQRYMTSSLRLMSPVSKIERNLSAQLALASRR